MIHTTSQIQFDKDKPTMYWRNLLTIFSEEPITFESSEVSIPMQTESGQITVTYYTDGLYRAIEEDGLFKYWFLYNETRMTIDGESEQLHDLHTAYNILTGGAE